MDEHPSVSCSDRPAPTPALTDLCCHFVAHNNELLFETVIDDDKSDVGYNSAVGGTFDAEISLYEENLDVDADGIIMDSDQRMCKLYANIAFEDAATKSTSSAELYRDENYEETFAVTNNANVGLAHCANALCDEPVYTGAAANNDAKRALSRPRRRRRPQLRSRHRAFRREAVPPRGLAERLLGALRCYCESGRRSDSQYLRAFVDERCCLQHLNLKNSSVTDRLLRNLLDVHGAQLVTLDLTDCERLTPALNARLVSSDFRPCRARHLSSLTIAGCTLSIFSHWLRCSHSAIVEPTLSEELLPAVEAQEIGVHTTDDQTSALLRSKSAVQKTSSEQGSSRASCRLSDTSSSATTDESAEVAVGSTTDNRDPDDALLPSNERRRALKRRSPICDDLDAENTLDQRNQSCTSVNEVSPDQNCSFEESTPCCSSHALHETELSHSSVRDSEITSSVGVISRCGAYILKNPIFTDICTNLTKLVLHGDELEKIWVGKEMIDKERVVCEFFERLLHPLQRLRHLDISYWSNINDLCFLEHRQLTTLILHDVPELYKARNVLCTLSCLDHIESDIYGLQSLKHKLDYLGIFYCDAASYFQRIPALTVSGDANEHQLLVAAEKYAHRPRLLLSVLNEMFQTYKFGVLTGENTRALHLLLNAMHEHDANVNVQIAGSASLFYVMRNVKMTFATKDRVINLLLNAMDNHMQEQTLVRNCCLSLCQIDVAVEMSHVYVDTFRVLLRVIRENTDTMIQRLVVHILNSLACSGQGDQKVAVGRLGALHIMLSLITQRLEAQNCDEVMEMAWSFLWNITDETPVNCQSFLDEGGMDLFKKCHEAFPDKNGLMRNMMGLVGNIAEVKELRHELMNADYVIIFLELLHNLSDGIEISYNSAGVLAHMLSEGQSAWTISVPEREVASVEVIKAVKGWQLTSKRYINYRSFEPIMRLLGENSSDASRYWAVWALANLTTVDGAKYCKFILDENGINVLTNWTSHPDANFRDLVSIVLRNVASYVTAMINSSCKTAV